MQLTLAFLAKYADTAEDATINAIGADFDSVAVGSVPASVDIFVVAKFQVGHENIDKKYQVSLELTDPQNNVVTLARREVSSKSVKQEEAEVKGYKATMIVKIGLVIKDPGVHRVNLSVDDEQVRTWPLEITLLGA